MTNLPSYPLSTVDGGIRRPAGPKEF